MPFVLNGLELAPGQPFTVADIQYSGIELTLWTRGDLEALGLVWVEPEPLPEPEPVRRLIPKSTVQARVIELGKIEAVWAALNADIANLVRWLAPDWPNVYFDDEGLMAVLAAVGCTSAEIEAITAP